MTTMESTINALQLLQKLAEYPAAKDAILDDIDMSDDVFEETIETLEFLSGGKEP